MSYDIILPKSVEKELNKLSKQFVERIIRCLKELSDNPFPRISKKLTNRDGWRIRIGDYRILYDVNTNLKEIYIRKILHRKDIYR